MFGYYNIIWIICIIMLFLALSVFLKRKRAMNRVPAAAGTHPNNFVVVDMNGTPLHHQSTQPATYAPPPPTTSSSHPPAFTTYRPTDTSISPPPPSYQDYSKDYPVQQTH